MIFFKKKKETICKNYNDGMCSLILELQELTKQEKN